MSAPYGSEIMFWEGAWNASRFFMGDADVHRALTRLIATLEEASIPYAIADGLALNEYGYQRVTTDVDVLLTREGLAKLKDRVVGLGYVEKFPGSKGLRDTEHGVTIDVLIAGDYPGEGRAKPVVFPDPARIAQHGHRGAYLPIETLVELKLASGLSAPHRLRDLADVLELVRISGLPRDFADRLDPSVREKYGELWEAAQAAGDEESEW